MGTPFRKGLFSQSVRMLKLLLACLLLLSVYTTTTTQAQLEVTVNSTSMTEMRSQEGMAGDRFCCWLAVNQCRDLCAGNSCANVHWQMWFGPDRLRHLVLFEHCQFHLYQHHLHHHHHHNH